MYDSILTSVISLLAVCFVTVTNEFVEFLISLFPDFTDGDLTMGNTGMFPCLGVPFYFGSLSV